MRRRTGDELAEPVDEVVHRRFVRVIGLSDPSVDAGDAGDADVARQAGGTGADAGGTGAAPVDGSGAGATAVPGGTASRALAAFDPGRRGVRALGVVAVVVIVAAGFVAWRSRPHADPVAPPAQTAATVVAPATSTPVLIVAVGGRVQHPGLVRLPAGARVAEAIEAAGGAMPGTDLSYVNLARKLVDGELLLIGVTPPPGAGVGGPAAGSGAAGGAADPGGPVNLNTASLTELQTLPGVGPVLAQRILDYRTEHGSFRSVEDLRQVDGIGDARFKQLKPKVSV